VPGHDQIDLIKIYFAVWGDLGYRIEGDNQMGADRDQPDDNDHWTNHPEDFRSLAAKILIRLRITASTTRNGNQD